MTVEDQIAKLQRLLHRVLARSSEPRPNGVSIDAPEVPAVPAAEIALSSTPEPSAVYAPVPLDDATQELLESRSRLVSAPLALEDEELDELSQDDLTNGISVAARARLASSPVVEVTEITEPNDLGDDAHDTQEAGANEIDEPAPSSSRRPIATEQPPPDDEIEDSSPRHTPPPESGKQVAALPIAERDFTPEVTAVRRSSVPAPMPQALPPAVVQLASEVSRASIDPSDSVASIVSVPPARKVLTFGELLDETLGL